MERNLIEREINDLLEVNEIPSVLSYEIYSDAKAVIFPVGEFYGSLNERSFLRKSDLRTRQLFNRKELYFSDKAAVNILGEKNDWYLVEGKAMYKENGIEFYYTEKSITVNLQGWVKKSWVTVTKGPKSRTIGFEFDIHFGFMDAILTKAGLTKPLNKTKLTTHENSTDGFVVTMDGPRLEVATKPFFVNTEGQKELAKTFNDIKKFTKELQEGCKSGIPEKVAGLEGDARIFHYSKMESGFTSYPILKLPVGKKFSSNCSVWASPQATVAIPLSKVAALVDYIKKSEGKESGIALTGDARYRMGLRSEALYKAKFQVDALRKAIILKKPKIKLSNGKEVDSAIFSENLRGLLILLASYLWTSQLPYHFINPKPKDYEPFAKAFLPINVKAPFPEIYRKLLNNDEKLFFKEHFAKDQASRVNFFQLAKKNATKDDGKNNLFPGGRKELGKDSVHERQKSTFGSIPTWNDLIDHTLDASHKSWGNKLLVPLSNSIELDKTIPNVGLELRRIGFRPMFDTDWKRFMDNIFNLIKNI